jgi:hypothetical protein
MTPAQIAELLRKLELIEQRYKSMVVAVQILAIQQKGGDK